MFLRAAQQYIPLRTGRFPYFAEHISGKALCSRRVGSHFLTAAVLSTAWYYSRGEDPAEHLEKLRQRCAKIPPAVCGYYGVCGDTLGAGAFLSEALEASYLSKESWATVNRFTARVQAGIGAAGETGPRNVTQY